MTGQLLKSPRINLGASGESASSFWEILKIIPVYKMILAENVPRGLIVTALKAGLTDWDTLNLILIFILNEGQFESFFTSIGVLQV